MAVTEKTVALEETTLEQIQEELRAQGIGGWLFYDFHGLNPVASQLLGLPGLTRRYFVLIPATGRPVVLTHRIEQQPWEGWIGDKRLYVSWRELEAELNSLLEDFDQVAMEYAPGDAVPYVDLIPAGVVEMVRATDTEVVSSADLVSAFYARWTPEGEASHRRAAAILQDTAQGTFRRIGEMLRAGETPTEWGMKEWIHEELDRRGLKLGVDCIVAVNDHAANPHYAPSRQAHAAIKPGDLVLVDLWGKESENAVFSDQTWMGYVGSEVPERIQQIWTVVRDARDAAVTLVRERWKAGESVAGYEVDDAVRGVIQAAGYGDAFVHRTGHSMDRELHGSGPNIDNLETRDTRLLIPGVGFSVEPGIYLTGDLGFRTEFDVFLGPNGPEVTTPDPQREIILIEV